MNEFWEFYLFCWIGAGLIIFVALLELHAWWQDRQRWKGIRPYYGKPYDASSKPYRPNVDLRRVR